MKLGNAGLEVYRGKPQYPTLSSALSWSMFILSLQIKYVSDKKVKWKVNKLGGIISLKKEIKTLGPESIFSTFNENEY